MTERKLALFGIFRSGTNYTRTVMEWNYGCRLVTDEYGWKHGFFPIIVDRSRLEYSGLDTVFVTKSPFSSISSLFRYYRDNGRNIIAARDWKNFIRQRFVIHDSFQENSPQYRFANVVEFWNSMNWNYLSAGASGRKCVHVSYEAMLGDACNESGRVAAELSLDARYTSRADFRIPEKVTRNMGDAERNVDGDYLTDRVFEPGPYAGRTYLGKFDIDDLKFVCGALDPMLVDRLGYRSEVEYVLSLVRGG